MSEQTYYPQPPGGNFFQRFGNEWKKTNMLQKMGLQHDPNQKGIGINPLMANPVTAVAGITSWALQKANRDHTGTDTTVEGGINVAKDRPGGLMRGITGTADFVGDLTGQTWDFDRQGQWFGNYGKGEEGQVGSVADNYEIIGGQAKPKTGTELENPTGPEGGPRVDSKKKKEKEESDELSSWNKKVDRLEGIAQKGQRRQMIHGGLTGMGESIMEGTIRGAQSLDQAQVATATMIANMPKLQLTAMKYAQQQDYGLG
jgi:hypothetical protein